MSKRFLFLYAYRPEADRVRQCGLLCAEHGNNYCRRQSIFFLMSCSVDNMDNEEYLTSNQMASWIATSTVHEDTVPGFCQTSLGIPNSQWHLLVATHGSNMIGYQVSRHQILPVEKWKIYFNRLVALHSSRQNRWPLVWSNWLLWAPMHAFCRHPPKSDQ